MGNATKSRRSWRSFSLIAACLVALGCAADPGSGDSGDSGDSGEPDPVPQWPLPRTCVAPPDLGRPSTIEQVVALVDALPKPTTLPCLLESLDRPLALYASTSTAGAQPASGPENPRIFLFEGDLALSVVAQGESTATLELSHAIGDRMSIKAELVFPVEDVLEPSAPYDQVDLGNGTSCGLCHGSETRVDSIEFANAWASDMFQDDPDQSLSLAFLRQGAIDCDPEAEPRRCEMLGALFGHGEVTPRDLARDSLICRSP